MFGGKLLDSYKESRIRIDNMDLLHSLFGNLDEHVKKIENGLKVKISAREGDVVIRGNDENVESVRKLLLSLVEIIKKGEKIDEQKIDYALTLTQDDSSEKMVELNESVLCVTSRGKLIKPKTIGQQIYCKTIREKDVTFGIGPAGTGKTFLAVAMAVRAFKNQEVNRIIITRPAVEAGENLGFLPGDLQDKVDPYLRPLYDSLYEILGADTYLNYKERGLIEVAPLAYMRGRTLDNSFIILDEAQNTTIAQMKMFLTRFGFGSKVIVNGDITQQDLPKGKTSGLLNAINVLKDVDEIGKVYLTEKDVVRHRLVRRIIKEYDKYEKEAEKKLRRSLGEA